MTAKLFISFHLFNSSLQLDNKNKVWTDRTLEKQYIKLFEQVHRKKENNKKISIKVNIRKIN